MSRTVRVRTSDSLRSRILTEHSIVECRRPLLMLRDRQLELVASLLVAAAAAAVVVVGLRAAEAVGSTLVNLSLNEVLGVVLVSRPIVPLMI